MSVVLNPAAEFDYNPRVRELFANLRHAGSLSVVGAVRDPPSDVMRTGGLRTNTTLSATAGSREQGASVTLYIDAHDAEVKIVKYQAYGCPHFLAACESLAQWMEGRPITELSQWRWRDVETELAVPASKRARLLLLDEALSALTEAL